MGQCNRIYEKLWTDIKQCTDLIRNKFNYFSFIDVDMQNGSQCLCVYTNVLKIWKENP